MENIYLYIRYSTEKQEQGSSYDRQLSMARQQYPSLIEDKAHVYFDKGKSAYKGEHLEDGGELKRFYDAVEAGVVPKGSTLLVEDLDRLSRDGMWKASDKLRELTENGIAVVTLRDGKRYEGVLKISDALTSLIKQELAHEESVKKSGRVADSYVKRYAAARAGKKVKVLLPSWLEWVGDYEPYKVKEAEAVVVREIFDLAAAGHSYAAIAKVLNQRGTKPFRSKDGDDKVWITASLFALIKNEAVLGTYKPKDGGPPIPDYFPPILEKQVFDMANGARSERKRGKDTRTGALYNLWTKVGVCAHCGRTLHMLPKSKHGTLYLVCSGKTVGACTAKNIRADKAEFGFREVLLNAVSADYLLGDNRDDQMKTRELEGKLDAVQQRRTKLLKLLNVDPMAELVAALKQANSERDALNEQKAELDQATAQRENLSRSREALLAKIDLTDKPARIEANSVLRRLKISVEVERVDPQIVYTVKQAGERILLGYQVGEKVMMLTYTKETAIRAHELGDTLWPELAITRPWGRNKDKAEQPTSTELGPNWTPYDDTLPDDAYDLLDEHGKPIFSPDTYRDEYSIPDENGNFSQYADEDRVLHAPDD